MGIFLSLIRYALSFVPKSVLGGALAFAVFWPHRAEAQTMPSQQMIQSAWGMGVFAGYAFGERTGVEWGFEMFATRFTKPHYNCDSSPRAGFGPFAQLAVVGTRHPRITLGLEAGGQFKANLTALTGKAGGTFRGGEQPGFGLHLAAQSELAFAAVTGKTELFLDDYAVLGGLRMAPTYGFSTCISEEVAAQ
jgi:hypothetical protein